MKLAMPSRGRRGSASAGRHGSRARCPPTQRETAKHAALAKHLLLAGGCRFALTTEGHMLRPQSRRRLCAGAGGGRLPVRPHHGRPHVRPKSRRQHRAGSGGGRQGGRQGVCGRGRLLAAEAARQARVGDEGGGADAAAGPPAPRRPRGGGPGGRAPCRTCPRRSGWQRSGSSGAPTLCRSTCKH